MAFGSSIPPVSTPTEGLYKNYPVLTLPNVNGAEKPGVQMGVAKLKAVLANLDAVRAFVAKHDKPKAAKLSPDIAAVLETLKTSGATAEMMAAVMAKLVTA